MAARRVNGERHFASARYDIFEFDENGKVVDHWHEADHLLLYQQVGGEIRPK